MAFYITRKFRDILQMLDQANVLNRTSLPTFGDQTSLFPLYKSLVSAAEYTWPRPLEQKREPNRGMHRRAFLYRAPAHGLCSPGEEAVVSNPWEDVEYSGCEYEAP